MERRRTLSPLGHGRVVLPEFSQETALRVGLPGASAKKILSPIGQSQLPIKKSNHESEPWWTWEKKTAVVPEKLGKRHCLPPVQSKEASFSLKKSEPRRKQKTKQIAPLTKTPKIASHDAFGSHPKSHFLQEREKRQLLVRILQNQM